MATASQRSPSPTIASSLLPKQLDLVASTAREVAYIGGYGSGKSRGGAAAAVARAVENDGDGMLVAPSYPMLVRVVLPAFLDAAKDLVRRHHKHERRLELVTGNQVWLGTADSPGALEGSNLSWAWMDEARLCSWEAYRILLGRVRDPRAKRPQLIVTSTPCGGTWLEEVFGTQRDGVETIHASSRENFLLSPDYVDSLLDSYSEAEARAYVEGDWIVLGEGRVYPEFDPALHCVPYSPIPSLPVICGVDFGYRWPAVVYAQIMPSATRLGPVSLPAGSVVVFDEDVTDGLSTEAMAKRISARVAARGLTIGWLAVDPAGANFSSAAAEHRGLTDLEALRQSLREDGITAPVRYLNAKGALHLRSVNTGIEKIRAMLRNARGVTTLYVSSDLITSRSRRGLVRSLQNMVWRRDDCKPQRGEKGGQLDHINDALRYLVRHLDLSGASTMSVA